MAMPRPILILAALLCVVQISFLARRAAGTGKTSQLTVFWGRHKDEGSLREACDSGMYTAVIVSFLNIVSGHDNAKYNYNLDLSGHPLAGIGDDIKHCQITGVPVSLSLRGAGALPTNQSALHLSDHLWFSYLSGFQKGVRRPFGDAKLDGVDFFLDHGKEEEEYYGVLAKDLQAKRRQSPAGTTKPLQLTATPGCALLTAGRALAAAGITLERIHVRFYGDASCSGGAWVEDAWGKWAAAYRRPGSRIYLGLTASGKTEDGYLYPKELYYGVIPEVQKAANYGGVMLWDRYYDKRNEYSSYVKYWA
ncbi:xylanase inhibitor protein 1 [Brachypodium distachyon]|uniref:GH18 domain-containing protein n=1 Tax=Brachypodium distachyon TaxID=15368 RepID=I1IIH1_BRADI|nr:xylanase inhibitor protein 1 [Brachypodium distachyon]PNT62722.1 hypothetical protein BRADI_4g07560v3 [Brachypodium distachyon]|eukprot:XP_003576258.1 xylanase inhibitor protein 1 [Brachypodium distachyon]